MHNYKELEVWKKAIELAELVYSISANFPEHEKFGLTSQIRRSSVSVASNIAEGAGRNSEKEFAQFLGYAYGSCCELETQWILSKKIGYLTEESEKTLEGLISQIQKMIYSLKRSLIK
jgi:four helix bundle protein